MNYLTCKQVAEKLSCSERYIQYLVADGEIEAVNIARTGRPKYRIAESEVARFAERNVVPIGASQ